MRTEDKLVDLKHTNPYLHLEDEGDFPDLEEPLPDTTDVRIARKQKLRAASGSKSTDTGSEMLHSEDEEEEDWDAPQTVDGAASQDNRSNKSTKAQRKR